MDKVQRCAVVTLMVLAGAIMTTALAAEGDRAAERQTGELNGVVVGTEAVKAEGVVRLALTITTEGGDQQTFIVGPGNPQAYATVGSLKAGEKVRLSWVSEGGDQKWIKGIRRLEGTGEKVRKEGERREGGDQK